MIEMRKKLYYILIILALIWVMVPHSAFSSYHGDYKIVDYRGRIHPNFKKITRKRTEFIIVHTSEGGLRSTLNVVTKGKIIKGRRITYGGHAHYVIARNGQIYRTLDKKYRADHAGRSLWNGIYDISSYSIGIELVGYHYDEITQRQYNSLKYLLTVFKRVYCLTDHDILTHSQVAYGRPNKWIPRNHRGRKRCAENFDRKRAGLRSEWTYDPDVRAGRLAADEHLATIFYVKRSPVLVERNNVISKFNTAWTIAGGDHDSPFTYYKLPDKRLVKGDKIGKLIGWKNIPSGTIVLLNQNEDIINQVGPIKIIKGEATAWSIAGHKYRRSTTFYFYNGRLCSGSDINDWDDIPDGTRMVIDYRGPFTITNTITPYSLAGFKYNHEDVIYYIPYTALKTGKEIKNFRDLPDGTAVLLPFTLKSKFAKK
jgi:N-acetylmuramoyl-L-alanine amidase